MVGHADKHALHIKTGPAHRQLPHAALVAVKPDGSLAFGAIMGSILRDPLQLPQLMRTAADARAALKTLFRSRKLLAARSVFTISASFCSTCRPKTYSAGRYYDAKYPIKSRLIQVDKPWIADQTHAWINASIVRLQREQNAKAEKAIRQGAKKIDKRRAFLFRRLDYQFLELIDDDTISTSE